MGCWANCPGTGLFGKGNACRDCKDRCNSWFPGDSTVQCGCKERCASGDENFSRDDYLNSIGQGPIQQQANEQHNQEVLAQMARDEEKAFKNLLSIVSAGVGVLVIVLIVYALIKINKG